jgi:hypothetical protein
LQHIKEEIVKRFIIIFTLLLTAFLFIPCSSFGYITYLEIDESINLGSVSGFQFDVLGYDIQDLELEIFYAGEQVDVDGVLRSPAVPTALGPNYPWEITTTPTGIFAYDNSYGTFPLSAGVILSLESSSDVIFLLDNLVLADNNSSTGYYEDSPYFLPSEQLSSREGSVFTISAVPVPSSIFLLGGGLLGFLAYRRKQRS